MANKWITKGSSHLNEKAVVYIFPYKVTTCIHNDGYTELKKEKGAGLLDFLVYNYKFEGYQRVGGLQCFRLKFYGNPL